MMTERDDRRRPVGEEPRQQRQEGPDREREERRHRRPPGRPPSVGVDAELQPGVGVEGHLALADRMRATVSASSSGHAPGPVHGGQLTALGLGLVGQLLPFHSELPLHQLVLGPHRHQLAGRHGESPGEQAGHAGQADRRGVGRGPGHAQDRARRW